MKKNIDNDFDLFFLETELNLKKHFFSSILYLSTGLIAFSTTFTQNYQDTAQLNSWLLISSWISLGFSIACVLLFYLISQIQFKQVQKTTKFRKSEDYQVYKVFIEGELEEYLIDQNNNSFQKFWINNGQKIFEFAYNKLGFITAILFLIGLIFMIKYSVHLLV